MVSPTAYHRYKDASEELALARRMANHPFSSNWERDQLHNAVKQAEERVLRALDQLWTAQQRMAA